jgi:Zn-dependent protease
VFGGGTSLQLFRIFGFRVGVHWSWFLILFFWILQLKGSLDSAIEGTGQGFIAAVISAALFFGSIVAHELGHAFAARREGIGVGGIELFFFGGFMRADRDSQTAGEEFRVAAAGPAVTLLLAIAFGALAVATLGSHSFGDAARLAPESGSMIAVLAAFTALANAAVFLLNIVPAFPLDGGRILRAIVWQLTGDRHKATTFSAYLGQGFAVLMMGYGVYRLVGDEANRQSGIWWLVLGWMLGGAARAAIAQSKFVNRLEGITASDIMDAEPVTIPASISALTAWDDYFLRYQGWIWFPAVEEDGRFVGLAHRAAVEHAALSEGGTALVRELVADADSVPTDTTLETLVGSEPLRTLGAVMAVDPEGHLRGVVTRDQVSRALQSRLATS